MRTGSLRELGMCALRTLRELGMCALRTLRELGMCALRTLRELVVSEQYFFLKKVELKIFGRDTTLLCP